MRRLGFALCLLLLTGGIAHGAPADCPRTALSPRPANLAKILNDHGKWLATRDTRNPKGGRADLRNLDLTGVSLVDSDLRDTILTGAKLQGAKLDRARLDLAELTCVLADSASLAEANLFQATLTNASLVSANFAQAKLGGALLAGAELASADFSNADMRRTNLASAAMRNTTLAGAQFADVDLQDTIWQPFDLPDVGTMGSVTNLKTIKLDAGNPDPGAMTRLAAALREAGLDDRAKEAAHARERAMVAIDLAKWSADSDILALGSASFRIMIGWLTDYGLSLTRGLLIFLGCNLAFALVYFRWGFTLAPDRATGLVTILREKTVVPGPSGETQTTADKIVPLAPASLVKRLLWAMCFAGLTAFRFGVGWFNPTEILEKLLGWGMGASGWLRYVAGTQTLISLVLIGCLGYAYLP